MLGQFSETYPARPSLELVLNTWSRLGLFRDKDITISRLLVSPRVTPIWLKWLQACIGSDKEESYRAKLEESKPRIGTEIHALHIQLPQRATLFLSAHLGIVEKRRRTL